MVHHFSNQFILDRKQSHPFVRTVFIFHQLPVPLNLIDIKRNLLNRFKLNNLRDFFGLDGRKINEPGKAVLTGNRNGDFAFTQVFFVKKFLERLDNNLFFFIRGNLSGGQIMRVLKIGEVDYLQSFVPLVHLKRLQCIGTNVNRPHAAYC